MAQTTFCVFGKRIHIVFALPKDDVQHKFSLWRIFKPQRRKFERGELAGIKQVDNTPAVHRIARQSVCVPRQNSVGFALLYAIEHTVKNRSARNFGTLLFNQHINHIQIFLLGKGAQFCDLIFNTPHLLIFHIGGLAGV
ncbi:MAG TPA: hypothetical protein VNM40_00225 [Candidatus Paceibacterota bacterium]|nr:hypothetical protein [Candidatus Paceibacterota bacterium]